METQISPSLARAVQVLQTQQDRVIQIAQWVLKMRQQAAQHCFSLPVRHLFSPGLYTRQVYMPQGALIVSKIHLTEHPYVLSAGALLVWTPQEALRWLRAPYLGVTTPGTLRVILVLEEAVWTTFHPTTHQDPQTIEQEVVVDPTEVIPLLTSNQVEPTLVRGEKCPSEP